MDNKIELEVDLIIDTNRPKYIPVMKHYIRQELELKGFIPIRTGLSHEAKVTSVSEDFKKVSLITNYSNDRRIIDNVTMTFDFSKILNDETILVVAPETLVARINTVSKEKTDRMEEVAREIQIRLEESKLEYETYKEQRSQLKVVKEVTLKLMIGNGNGFSKEHKLCTLFHYVNNEPLWGFLENINTTLTLPDFKVLTVNLEQQAVTIGLFDENVNTEGLCLGMAYTTSSGDPNYFKIAYVYTMEEQPFIDYFKLLDYQRSILATQT